MKFTAIPQTHLNLSSFILGTGVFGTGVPIETTERLYAQFREAGGNTFDTAHCYCFWLPTGAGASERALGQTIRKFNDRDNIFIITKGGHPPAPPAYPHAESYLSPEAISSDIHDSLERLGFDSIDLYLLHRDDPRLGVEVIIDALNQHIAAGRIRSIGVSNWPTARIAQANAYARSRNLHGFVASQPQYSLAHINAPEPKSDPANRYLYDHDIAWHTQTQLPVVCYSPTAGGYFATGGERGKGAYENPISRARLLRAQELGVHCRATPNQIALAYLIAQPFPTIPILGTADPEHLADCLGAAHVALTPNQVRWLRDGD